jgi:hypothetical protein
MTGCEQFGKKLGERCISKEYRLLKAKQNYRKQLICSSLRTQSNHDSHQARSNQDEEQHLVIAFGGPEGEHGDLSQEEVRQQSEELSTDNELKEMR